MSNHTPGPWCVNGKQSIRGANGEYIARTNWQNGEANACLISAAPDLLELVKALVDTREKHFISYEAEGVYEWDGRALAAINKAKGAA